MAWTCTTACRASSWWWKTATSPVSLPGEEGKYVRFNAAKGVVLATGDYQCNNEMIAYYCPDVLGYPPLEIGRDGDGHRMGVWAGGHVEPVGHTKMIHDIWMNSAPYLMVGPDGAV